MPVVGVVREIWRYPVKSMLGERLERAQVGAAGVDGDRRYALRDVDLGTVLSGKRVAAMFSMRARATAAGVTVRLPNGADTAPGAPGADDLVSAVVGRAVTFARVEDHTPVIECVGDGSTHVGEPGTFDGLEGTFFDAWPLHLVTDASLARLSQLAPGSRFDARRFRPNLLIHASDGDGFVEESWVGREVRVGGARLAIRKTCSRCVMTTLPQDDLARDRTVLQTVARENANHVGVYAAVTTPGPIAVGEDVTLH